MNFLNLNRTKIFTFVQNYSRSYRTHVGVYGYKPRDNSDARLLTEQIVNNQVKSSSLSDVVREFRESGHYFAQVDPLRLSSSKDVNRTLLLKAYLDKYENDNTIVETNGLINTGKRSSAVSEVVKFLKNAYCGTVGVEFMHVNDLNEREWLTQKWEELNSKLIAVDENEKKKIAETLLKCELFDNFVATKYPTVKRYACEGAESMLVFFNELLAHSTLKHNIKDVVIGMPHRGRLNLLVCLLQFSPKIVFRKMQGLSEFDLDEAKGTVGDVLSHLYTSTNLQIDNNNNRIHVSLLPNPSHLEAVNPVVAGKVRGKAMSKQIGPYSNNDEILPILPVQIHGDAAFAGQGIVMETLAMSNVPHFNVDGSIHCVVNNQIGYTTPGDYCGRSSHYCSDIMKMINAPCIHVNGDNPEDVMKVTRLAIDYRQKFRKDILIDLICFRQYGHNELDDPTFTNPIMYKAVHSRDKTLAHKYAENVLTKNQIDSLKKEFWNFLNVEFKNSNTFRPSNPNLKGVWQNIKHPTKDLLTVWNTGVDVNQLASIGVKSVEMPTDFNIHKTLIKSLINDRLQRFNSTQQIEWATAEMLAFGSLLCEGFNIRISGQDVGRGTFSQRHAMIVDQSSGEIHIPMNNLIDGQSGHLEIANSILSEEAVLGFEYGMSIDSPKNLVIWEAQFGDFFNGAQIIFDTFISSGELKWLLQSGLVILLPHGYDGAGSEHSSCRIERFLQMCDSSFNKVDGDGVNWSVTNPTTPAQYFHLLRRQMIRNFRKPLIVATPKLLLRHPQCISNLNDFGVGSYFKPVLDDHLVSKPTDVKKVVFCSGKHFYALNSQRVEQNLSNVAIIRLEELCPFPVKDISSLLSKYTNATDFIWSQEEQENMGAWSFVNPRFRNIFNCDLKYVGRGPLGTPAVGIGSIHKEEHQSIISNTFRNT